jgi:hypothetical protein
MLRQVNVTRYVTPFREGGSLPGLMEADDLGTYVVKYHGAGQGRKALVAEIIAGELGRRLGFRVPELVLATLDEAIGRHEPDPDIQDLLKASTGLNLGVDFLPGSLNFDPLGWKPERDLAARVLWFDALIGNVDRSWRNPNLLVWHGDVWLIDHGASLYFHHAWKSAAKLAARPYDAEDHVFAPFVRDLSAADAALAPEITEDLLREVTALVPDLWLTDEPGFDSAAAVRDAYVEQLLTRVAAPRTWLPEAVTAAPKKPASDKRPEWLGGSS